MVTTGIKNASKLPSAKGEWQEKEAMTAGDGVFSGCLTEMYHITPMYETTSPFTYMHPCTNNHIHISSPSPHLRTEQWNCTQHKFYCC